MRKLRLKGEVKALIPSQAAADRARRRAQSVPRAEVLSCYNMAAPFSVCFPLQPPLFPAPMGSNTRLSVPFLVSQTFS